VRTQLELSRLRRDAIAQRDRLRTLFRVAPAAIAVVRGPDHVFELSNDLYFQLVGRTDIVGKPGREALPELTAQGVWDRFDRVFAGGEPYVTREASVRIDRLGTGVLDEGYFEILLQPLKDLRGQTEGILIHAIDVTDKVLSRQRIEEAREAAEGANRAKDEFLAMLGHELRNPLAPILTALQLMTLRGNVGAEKERAVIDRQVRHVVRLVDDLLDVARIARGRIDLEMERVELSQVVARAVEMAGPLIEQRQHDLTVQVPRSGLIVDGDPTRLYQVILNLLTNACKYTEPAGRIVISATREGDEIELRVRDNGIGIDAAMLPKIFDLFIQERQSLERSQGGLGLGLTIVRSLVELHGGTVTGLSAGAGRGSEFVVRLPAASPQPLDGEALTETAGAERAPGERFRILVVDDNADAAELLSDALQTMGHETRIAFDGPSAIEATAAFEPHVALLDLGLPVMDGYELAEQLRSGPCTPRLIAVTGYGQERDRARSRASGFEAHVVKPVDVEQLFTTIRELMSESPGDVL
jgi:signal transduction histidine kinase/ActR/RegA family two-component response regulator